MKVKRALVSVSDKNGLEPFVRGLIELGVEVISTGGTAKHLRDAGLKITGISEVTGFPEIMDGRVKTLHPAIHGGILADRSKPAHLKAIEDLGIAPIDLVVVNLYPFEQTVAQRGVSEADAVENIDIGGPSMVRSAAKNFSAVGIVTDPADYDTVLDELKAGAASYRWRRGAPWRPRPFITPLTTTRPSPTGSASRKPTSPSISCSIWPRCRSCATARTRISGPRGTQSVGRRQPDGRGGAAPRRPALVQQPARPRRGPALPGGVRSAGLRHREAQQSLRRGSGRDRYRGLREGALVRPHLGVRRRHRLQPAAGRGGGQAAEHQLRRGALGARLLRRGPQGAHRQREHPHPDRPAQSRHLRLAST